MKLLQNKKRRLIALAGLLILAAACACALLLFAPHKENDEVTFKTVSLSQVGMKQTITAAGKVTAGQSEKVKLNEKKKFLAATVDEKEIVRKGQPLIFYKDGSHTDAPNDGVVISVHTPERGESPSASDYINFKSTSKLYLSIKIPEDRINDMSQKDTATIKINAMPEKEFEGQLIRINGMSNSLISQVAQKKSEESESAPGDDSSAEDSDSTIDDEESDEEEDVSDDDDSENGGSMAYYTVLVEFANDGTVRPGMSANSIVTISNREKVQAIPVEAVHFDENDKPYVNIINGNKTKRQEVTLGESDAMNVEITDGLKSSDRIRIVYGNGGNEEP